jgi:hypothetical protein
LFAYPVNRDRNVLAYTDSTARRQSNFNN